MCFGGPSTPAQTAPPPTATPSDPVVVAALDRERRRQGAMKGRQSTILTSGLGVVPAPASAAPAKTVLGA